MQQWIAFVKQEHEAPDLWEELRRQRELILGERVENTPFSDQEQEQLAAHLNETRENVRTTFELEPGEYELIESRLEYLVEASQRVGRVDWRHLLTGSFLSLVIEGCARRPRRWSSCCSTFCAACPAVLAPASS